MSLRARARDAKGDSLPVSGLRYRGSSSPARHQMVGWLRVETAWTVKYPLGINAAVRLARDVLANGPLAPFRHTGGTR